MAQTKKAAGTPSRGRSASKTPAKSAAKSASPAAKKSPSPAPKKRSSTPAKSSKKAAAAAAPADAPSALESVAASSPARSVASTSRKAAAPSSNGNGSNSKEQQLATVAGVTSALASLAYTQMKTKAVLTAKTQGWLSILPIASIGYLSFTHHRASKTLQSGSYASAVLSFIVVTLIREIISLQGFANAVVDFLPFAALAYAVFKSNGGKANLVTFPAVLAAFLALDAYTSKVGGLAALKALYLPATATLGAVLPALSRFLATLSASGAVDRAIADFRAKRSTKALHIAAATLLLSPFFSNHVSPLLLGALPVEAKALKEIATWAGVYLLADSAN